MGPVLFGLVRVTATSSASLWSGAVPPREAPRAAPLRAGTGVVDWNRADPSLQYGGATLEAACAFAYGLKRHRNEDPIPPARRTGVRPSLGSVDGLQAVVKVLVQLPGLRVRLSDSRSGEVIREHLTSRRLGIAKNRIAQGVLPIPASDEEYLTRGRRILRRQVRRAKTSGASCELVTSYTEKREILDWLTPRIPGMDGWVDTLPHRPDDEWWVARSSSGEPIAFAIVVVDGKWAMLELLRSTDHPARHLLHTEIVASLRRAGASYLITDSPMVLRMDPELRYFQRMLGYRVAHLRLR
jgi:hypothetical protein